MNNANINEKFRGIQFYISLHLGHTLQFLLLTNRLNKLSLISTVKII